MSGALLADIGGTNARFALASSDPAVPALLPDSVQVFSVADFPSLADAARHYLDRIGASPTDAVFAVAGRVDGDEARITNHPWVISAERTRIALGLTQLRLVNDFAAQAMAVSLLQPSDVVPIGGVRWNGWSGDGDRTYAIIGAGTGLGVGALLRRDGRYYPLQTEGGHVSFAPGTPEEIEVLQRLSGEFGRVSNERLLSGSGLVNLHRALHPQSAEDTPERITAAADSDPQCRETIERFCAMLGSIAGDFALAFGAWDGVYLAGGLTPKLLRWLGSGGFRARFDAKGRYAGVLARIPTIAILHGDAGLLGAAALALLDAGRPLPGSAMVDSA